MSSSDKEKQSLGGIYVFLIVNETSGFSMGRKVEFLFLKLRGISSKEKLFTDLFKISIQ